MLVVDDHEDVRLLVRVLLETHPVPFEVREATDGHQALAVATAWAPDAIVLDLMMPGMSGLDTLAALRERGCEARVVIFSAVRRRHLRQRAVELGAHAFVEKGYDGLLEALL